jgi:hypothetical protein
MRGRKEVFWVVVISAALVTAGLSLSCGDEDNGEAEVNCQSVCERLDYCVQYPYAWQVADFFEYYAAPGTCDEACELMLEDDEWDYGLVNMELLECIMDTDCLDIKASCFCQGTCEKLKECDLLDFWGLYTMAYCVYYCEEHFYMWYEIPCISDYFPDCKGINDNCSLSIW